MAAGGHLGYTKMAVTSHLSPRYIGTDARGCAAHLMTAQMAATVRTTAVAYSNDKSEISDSNDTDD